MEEAKARVGGGGEGWRCLEPAELAGQEVVEEGLKGGGKRWSTRSERGGWHRRRERDTRRRVDIG